MKSICHEARCSRSSNLNWWVTTKSKIANLTFKLFYCFSSHWASLILRTLLSSVHHPINDCQPFFVRLWVAGPQLCHLSHCLLAERHTSHSAILTRSGSGEGCLIWSWPLNRLRSVGSFSQRWLLPSQERVEERKRREGEGGGENLASSPHASLNRPTRLVERSHQSLGKRMRERHEETEGKRRSRLVKWS